MGLETVSESVSKDTSMCVEHNLVDFYAGLGPVYRKYGSANQNQNKVSVSKEAQNVFLCSIAKGIFITQHTQN